MAKEQKAKYWTIVVYNENLKDDWEDELINIGLPMAYCTHNKTIVNDEQRKVHTHIIVAFNNTTTYNNVFKMFERLNAQDKKAFNKLEQCYNIEQAYKYLIHDTQDCEKKKKEKYDAKDRKCINNFDIGAYVQVSQDDKEKMIDELAIVVIEQGFTNFVDFYSYVLTNYEKEYTRVLRTNSGFFERLTKGNYQKMITTNYSTTIRDCEDMSE